jgi:hypothetical protein
MKHAWIAAASLAATSLAQAHEGHGLSGSHWHATDSVGYLIVAALVAVGVWFMRRK